MNYRLQEKVKEIIQQVHKEPFGFCQLSQLKTMKHYKNWIQNQYHGEMSYLKKHIPPKENPQLVLEDVKSAISFQFSYYPLSEKKPVFPHLRTSLYSQMEDYHIWVKKKLQAIIEALCTEFPKEKFRAMTDSIPVLEREVAYQSGLGWFGKNSCLIHKEKGSLFFLGEIYTTLELKSFTPHSKNFCGQCTRCITACPTEAILENHQIDARKCISYLTIELNTLPPSPLRPQIKDWFFGCDICQTVCPWNEHAHNKQHMKSLSLPQQEVTPELISELKDILQSSHKSLKKRVSQSALSRRQAVGLKRNAIVVATNLKIKDLLPHIKKLLYLPNSQTPHPAYKEMVLWSINEFQKNGFDFNPIPQENK